MAPSLVGTGASSRRRPAPRTARPETPPADGFGVRLLRGRPDSTRCGHRRGRATVVGISDTASSSQFCGTARVVWAVGYPAQTLAHRLFGDTSIRGGTQSIGLDPGRPESDTPRPDRVDRVRGSIGSAGSPGTGSDRPQRQPRSPVAACDTSHTAPHAKPVVIRIVTRVRQAVVDPERNPRCE